MRAREEAGVKILEGCECEDRKEACSRQVQAPDACPVLRLEV